jgi:hypothetical protein
MTMPDEGGGGGGFMSQRFLGIPAVVWLVGAAIVAYLYFAHKSAAGQTAPASSTANQGTVTQTTGATTIDTGAVQVDVNAGGAGGTGLGGSVSGNQQQAASNTGSGTVTTGGTAGSNPQPTPPAGGSNGSGNPGQFSGSGIQQAISQLQSDGYNVNPTVILNGLAGVRQQGTLNPSQYGQYEVLGVNYSGQNAQIVAG